jgi:hypothetical protein
MRHHLPYNVRTKGKLGVKDSGEMNGLKHPPQSSPVSVPTPLSRRIWKSFHSFWCMSRNEICSRWYFFPVCLTVICGTAFFVGAVPTRVFGHDIFFLLENGWRVVNGQRPHVDYASAWGPVTFLIAGLGLTFSGFTVDGIGYGNAIFGLLVSLWSYHLVRDRLEPIPRILISLYLVGLIVAPYPLGWGVFHTSYAMVYNRYGYALLGLIMLESFETAGGQRREKEEWIGGFSSGVAAGLALFLKITYFFVAALLIGGSVFLVGTFPPPTPWDDCRLLACHDRYACLPRVRHPSGPRRLENGCRSQSRENYLS